jgi:hypothetical protein
MGLLSLVDATCEHHPVAEIIRENTCLGMEVIVAFRCSQGPARRRMRPWLAMRWAIPEAATDRADEDKKPAEVRERRSH